MILEFITSHLRDVVIIVTVYLVGHVALALYARKIGRRAAEHGASRGRSTRAKTVARLIHDVLHAVLLIIVA
ncbi:hypothetical protein HYS28_00595 [Candidatus Uhrbacteria bacterium]|nr:hypothetical protein [Candidatus Uhrbacteria bacterium]